MNQGQKNAAVDAVALLEARQQAVQSTIEVLSEGMSAQDRKDPLTGVIEMLARDAAGRGFDAGVKWSLDYTQKVLAQP